ncbi:MAG: fumarylacetoacetate hydrolase family protein [Thermodesulfobacteriota bacterium]|nr:fumarylacetoacetate hydrolase family protein [Thermodesulfobacteriota bacterium]
MKIVQFYDNSHVRLGLIKSDSVIPFDFGGDMIDFIKSKRPPGLLRAKPISLHHLRLAPPLTRPSKIIAIGLNYRDHVKESKGEIPEVPLAFAKFPNSITGHHGKITWDEDVTGKVDFEAELAVIIGKTVYNCPEVEALKAVFGYTCANDVSARDLQFGDGQWVRGKSLDTFCPLGPWLVTTEEITDPHVLKIRCWLNDLLMQDSYTGQMIFTVPHLISFLSRHFTLFPGDIILTGTPKGVGAFRKPSVYMKDGDKVVVEIEGIGRLVNRCRAR